MIVSPGFRPDHPWLLMARRMKKKVFGGSILHHFSQSLQSPQLQGQMVNLRCYITQYIFNKLGYKTTTMVLVFHYRN